ncbi:conserved hypothetical protein [Theileria orientalis strain Shintoku]|uniref:Uncharacterized protein n=1 Tax=Theileria orientalis strain Shintoku TaxID=869250 RepID=J7M4K7_THEOR|nr:conserved hypothetical protein [Theileria orientalis strain Shintoku]BAM38705.1 conserved hypothetical protein [Theileria orientalis strain Shintoku]|eukprot:XP_009689006.1 conserved hypothetical protein [Theileria orientalis strain Shintoku]
MTTVENADLSSIPSCLKQLQYYLDEAKYSEAAKLCHKCLKEWPGENTFYRVKVFCEIQLSRWHSCLQTIGWLHGYRTHPAVSDKPRKRRETHLNHCDDEMRKGQEALEKIRNAAKAHYANDNCLWFHFEQSYCYYKLGKYDLGLKALSMCTESVPPRELIKSQDEYPLDATTFPDTKSTLLKAQLCLRLGHFKEASEIYASLKLKGAESLLQVNRLSVDISLASRSPKDQRQQLLETVNRKIDDHMDRAKSDDPYELYFNYACACVLSNDVLKAQDYLDVANEMLENELKSEEYDPDEQVEFANIFAFRAFLNSKRGNEELARSINKKLLETFMK